MFQQARFAKKIIVFNAAMGVDVFRFHGSAMERKTAGIIVNGRCLYA